MGGANKLLTALKENPDKSVKEVFKENQIKANKNVFLNKDGTYKTTKDIYNWAAKKFNVEEYKNEKQKVTEADKPRVEYPEVKRDNIPSLANTPINPNYTTLPEKNKPNNKKEKSLTEKQVRQILQQEKNRETRRFSTTLNQPENYVERNYVPQKQPNLDYLYDYIDINNFSEGGKKDKLYSKKELEMLKKYYKK